MVFIPPEVVVFNQKDFGGLERRFNVDIGNLTWHIMMPLVNINLTWNDTISSVIVISGTWQFFAHENYGLPHSNQVKPGRYRSVDGPEVNITDGTISSLKVISYDPQGDGF
jgi:hypothetical protein